MLLFWVCAALLTAAAVLVLTRPLVAKSGRAASIAAATNGEASVAVYRDQLAEIENDQARGLISEAEAEAARIEIARRLLASAGTSDTGTSDGAETTAAAVSVHRGGERAFLAVAAAVPLVALALYLALGSPGMPGRPVAERLAKAPTAASGVEELVARVEARLRTNPTDGQGWDVIAPVYLRMERFQDAAEAFRRALDLLGESPARLSGYAESTVLANDGIVTEPARRAYQRLIELEPGRVEARFGLALAKEQEGDLDAAEKIYLKLIEEAPLGAPWRQFIGERIDAIAAKRSAPAGNAGGAGKGAAPGPAETSVIAGLPEAERRQMIVQMVESLETRLKANGRDPEGWQRLIRSWSVLGDKAKAEAALVAARKALAGDVKAIAEIDAFARSLGLKS
jgi:cytochrome c-type biogenesis protein CcmH